MNLAALFRPRPVAMPVAMAHPVAPVPVLPATAATRGKGCFVTGTVAATLYCTTITGFEALRTTAYRDSVGIPTICIGETKNVHMGMKMTVPECQAMLVKRLGEDYAPAVERCITRPMSDEFFAAAVSLTYNIGIGSSKHPGFCQSSVVRLYNAGERRAACNAFLAFDKGGKPRRVIAGLVNRRKAERALCLKGV